MKNKLKEEVEAILKLYPDTRNCDTKLMIQVWESYYNEWYIRLSPKNIAMLHKLPQRDDIARYRRKLNQDGIYLPMIEEVAIGRGLNIERWRKLLGYSIEHEDQMVMI